MLFVAVCQAVCCHAIMTYTADNSAKSLNTSGDPRPVTLYIATIDGEEPTFDIVYPPEGGHRCGHQQPYQSDGTNGYDYWHGHALR